MVQALELDALILWPTDSPSDYYPLQLKRDRLLRFLHFLVRSKTDFLFKDEFIGNRDFLYFSSGLKALHDYLNAKRLENEKGKKK